ncbi:transcriptional regulator, TetR family [Hymenobacter daecheongensis DSM 21074]|uniref:Transcriptional regulator, TetR family n=1 Tax=Hymenobacter daecheongensis DSM 21074 TaxID=1121955 RepID=A0A1M6BD11_9BACT|nr:TetR family transcriptional regulator [Hymenobacter daecheongensis]SHI46634.1 transcriptional regulator, TetR family [Hymenobacter daecheongensis DSM 21074]
MTSTLRDTLLEEALRIFQTKGITNISLEQIMSALDVSPATFHEMFQDKEDLVLQVTQHDISRQKAEHAQLFQRVDNAVARLLSLLEMGIRDLRKVTSPDYFADLIHHYPRAWEMGQQHLAEYSYPQIHSLLNEGILQKTLRGDINIALVSKIIIEQLYMVLNEQIFPPSRYDVAEVFRSVYLYYMRGLCTEEGLKTASTHFARM